MSTPGEQFADAIASHDAAALAALLADEVDFRGMTPGTFWEATTPEEVVDAVLGHWFEQTDRIVAATRAEQAPVGDTRHVSYRFDIDNDDGARVAEQQAYYRTEGDRIVWMRIVCSGFRPRGRPA
jgi:hypothetical protein